MSQIGIDLMCMDESQGMNYIISAIDYFTKFCELGALPNKVFQVWSHRYYIYIYIYLYIYIYIYIYY